MTWTDSSAPKVHYSETNNSQSSQQTCESNHATSAGAALEAALTKISDTGHMPSNKAPCDLSRTSKSTMKSTSHSVGLAGKTTVQQTNKAAQQALRLASTRRLEKEQAERAERIRAANL